MHVQYFDEFYNNMRKNKSNNNNNNNDRQVKRLLLNQWTIRRMKKVILSTMTMNINRRIEHHDIEISLDRIVIIQVLVLSIQQIYHLFRRRHRHHRHPMKPMFIINRVQIHLADRRVHLQLLFHLLVHSNWQPANILRRLFMMIFVRLSQNFFRELRHYFHFSFIYCSQCNYLHSFFVLSVVF